MRYGCVVSCNSREETVVRVWRGRGCGIASSIRNKMDVRESECWIRVVVVALTVSEDALLGLVENNAML